MANFEIYKSKDGYRWRLRARNGEIVAQSEAYTTKQNAIKGCEATIRAAKTANILYLKEDSAPKSAK